MLNNTILAGAALATAFLFLRAGGLRDTGAGQAPPVTMLKPIYGLERNLERNLKLVPGRFLIGEMYGPADLGIVCRQLSDRPACRVQPVDAKSY